VWGENVYIDVEPNINFCVRQIRGVLLDEAAHPRYIETASREGYRFLAAISGSTTSGDLHRDQADLPEAPADLRKTPIEVASVKPGLSRWLMAAIVLAALAVVGVVL
jgi:DNA-binding winged helix-turn-helix (wHTH) protein